MQTTVAGFLVAKRNRGEKDNFESNLTQVGTFGHVEQFWSVVASSLGFLHR